MTATMFAQSLYGGGGMTGQQVANPPAGTATQSAAAPGKPSGGAWGNVPVLTGVSSAFGMSVPMLVILGVIAWYLFRQY